MLFTVRLRCRPLLHSPFRAIPLFGLLVPFQGCFVAARLFCLFSPAIIVIGHTPECRTCRRRSVLLPRSADRVLIPGIHSLLIDGMRVFMLKSAFLRFKRLLLGAVLKSLCCHRPCCHPDRGAKALHRPSLTVGQNDMKGIIFPDTPPTVSAAQKLSLAQALALALQDNPQIARARIRSLSARNNLSGQRAPLNPALPLPA